MSFSDARRPWLLNSRAEGVRSSSSASLFTFDFAKKPKKVNAVTDVDKVKAQKDVSRSEGTGKGKSLIIPVKRKINFEDDESESEDEEDEQKVVKRGKMSKNKQEKSPKRILKPRQVEDSSTGRSRKSVKAKDSSKMAKPIEITRKSSNTSDETEICSDFSEPTEILRKQVKVTSNSSKTSGIIPKGRKTSLKPKQNQNPNVVTKLDLKKNKKSETTPNYSIIRISQPEEVETVSTPPPLEPCDGDAPLQFIVDPDMEDYFSLENSQEMGNLVSLKKSDLAQSIQFATPGEMDTKEVYTGITSEAFSVAEGTVTGYLTIEPRTIKPMERTLDTRLIYWILEGEVIIKSTAHVESGGNNVLYGKKLGPKCCIVVPPQTPYMLINKSEESSALLSYVLLTCKTE